MSDDQRLKTSLMNKTKTELIKLCKEKNLDVKGLKKDLVARLLSKKNTNQIVIKITKNKYGQFHHKETGLIFDSMTKRVIGKENNGAIDKLSRKDIEICKNFKFQYKLPETIEDDRTDVYEIIEDAVDSSESQEIDDEDNEIFDDSEIDEF